MFDPKIYKELSDNGNLAYLSGKLHEVIPGKTSEEQKAHFMKVMEYSEGHDEHENGTWTFRTVDDGIRKYGATPRMWETKTK